MACAMTSLLSWFGLLGLISRRWLPGSPDLIPVEECCAERANNWLYQ